MLRWDRDTLGQCLQPLLPGLQIDIVPETGSTNTSVLDRARNGDMRPCLMVAERQSAGRGRLGRPWWGEPGTSLTWSLGLAYQPGDWSGLSLAVGLALAQALDRADDGATAPRLGIKWPNDLWLMGEDRKLGGILIETLPLPDSTARWTVIGMGINILAQPASPEAAPEGGFRTGYACMQELLPGTDAPQVLHRVAPALLDAVQRYAREGLAPLLPAYARRDVLAGRRIQAGEAQGLALGPNATGALGLRRDDGQVLRISSGEVSVRPC